MIPVWLHDVSLLSLCLGAACSAFIALDLLRRPPRMGIMAAVWPICALFGSVAVLWFYLAHGRAQAPGSHRHRDTNERAPFAASVATGALHCGSGCTLGDVCGEALLLLAPQIAVGLGYPALFGDRMFAGWIADSLFAYAFGILFQFFAIAPMRDDLSAGQALIAAVKADTLSLISWQVGMFGFMAFAHVVLFGRLLGVSLRPVDASFWFAMQIAMVCGFATAFPMNWWLIRIGLKERM